jgi:hypothetical protein
MGPRTHRWLPREWSGIDHCFDCDIEKTRASQNGYCHAPKKRTMLDDMSQAAALGMYLDGWRVRSNLSVSSPRFPQPVTFETAIAVHVMETAREAFSDMCEHPPHIASEQLLPASSEASKRLSSFEAQRAIATLCDNIPPIDEDP